MTNKSTDAEDQTNEDSSSVQPEAVDTTDEPGMRVTAAARTFVITGTGAGMAAFNFGFDAGAFSNFNHRRFWAVWVICTVALVASFVFRNADYRLGGHWRAVLAIPTLWLLADLALVTTDRGVVIALGIVSVAALPFALYVFAHLLAGEYFRFPNHLRWALGILTLGIFLVGFFVGDRHPRFLTCDDFALAGEYEPDNCRR